MVKQTGTSLSWNTTGNKKEQIFDNMQQLRISEALYEMKKVSLKRLCTVWFHLFNVLEMLSL